MANLLTGKRVRKSCVCGRTHTQVEKKTRWLQKKKGQKVITRIRSDFLANNKINSTYTSETLVCPRSAPIKENKSGSISLEYSRVYVCVWWQWNQVQPPGKSAKAQTKLWTFRRVCLKQSFGIEGGGLGQSNVAPHWQSTKRARQWGQ